MDRILVEGGHRLEGKVAISGAKNAALPTLVSAILADGESRFTHVPDLKDVHSTIELIRTLGAPAVYEDHCVRIDGSGLSNPEAPYDIVRKMRASILVLGPLVARLGKARVSLPGGCAIGARPINLHLQGLERLGATIRLVHGYVEAQAPRLKGADIFFDLVSVTGTENLLMAAALAKGKTVLRNAAREPEVTALADTLNLMGAKIEGAGTSTIRIEGVGRLTPVAVPIIPDRIETGTFMVAAALTQGDLTLTGCNPEHIGAVIDKLRATGTTVEVAANTIRVIGPPRIGSVDVKTLPYPGFPTDMQAQFMVLMSISSGLSVIAETIFENRYIHVGELRRMGADITISGNSAVVRGVNKLSAAPVMASDLRASASLILAGLVAEGETEINRVYHLDRGYEALEKKFASLGAVIRRAK